jgi:hypothetical protein
MNTTFVPKQLPGCNYRRFNEHHTRITDIMRRLSDFKDELIVNSFRLEVLNMRHASFEYDLMNFII